ncbi:hypothetical protein EXU57_19525 [Segetibacter sp. 3557_3]|uniref:aromatic amino acid lyase n=1 Tax=Segetibacter sp. 3557_3 TaxID=2547429 RepID=UPI001058A7BE|nr:aromatic amino acid lyase [Segetibacter sp. 3557_3]TDH21392.1 hypothetical protein EXU57_19525 [Segetibacter sp. 3557_3]
MSYNYLPLDRKWLSFQQVKNLLDFDQLVSITFDAHERILKCRNYLEHKTPGATQTTLDLRKEQLTYNEVKGSPALYKEVPADVVKLMLMLKIKSLSFGYSGVRIEIVKHLLEMYNHGLLPVIFMQSQPSNKLSLSPQHQFGLAVAGITDLSSVEAQQQSATTMQGLNWHELEPDIREYLALSSGTQFITAFALYALKKAEQLIDISNLIAALSFDAAGCNSMLLHEQLQGLSKHPGQVKTAALLRTYLGDRGDLAGSAQDISGDANFAAIPVVHGAVRETFDHVLKVLLEEINSVSEAVAVFPDEDLILSAVDGGKEEPLLLALQSLSLAIEKLAVASQGRTNILMALMQHTEHPGTTAISNHNHPPSTSKSMYPDDEGGVFVSRLLDVMEHCFKLVATELIAAVDNLDRKGLQPTSTILNAAYSDFKTVVAKHDTKLIEQVYQVAAGHFVSTYKPGRTGD